VVGPVVAPVRPWSSLPSVGNARAARDAAAQFSADLHGMTAADLDSSALGRLHADLDGIQSNLEPLRGLLQSDPVVGALRGLAATHDSLTDVDDLSSAGEDLVKAGNLA